MHTQTTLIYSKRHSFMWYFIYFVVSSQQTHVIFYSLAVTTQQSVGVQIHSQNYPNAPVHKICDQHYAYFISMLLHWGGK